MKPAELDYALRAGVERLGRAGGVGLALAAGALAFYFAAVQPAQKELASLEARRSRIDQAPRASRPAAASAADFERFIGFFPGAESTPVWLRTIYAVGERQGLELLQGTYRLSEDSLLGLAYYRISLPVRGSYPQIRRFVAGVLDEVPAASLEHIVFQREKIGEAAVEAKISLTLHVQLSQKPALALRGAP